MAQATVTTYLNSATANGASFSFPYPAGTSRADFVAATGHYIVVDGAKYLNAAGGALFSFGASTITVTNDSGQTFLKGPVYVNLDEALEGDARTDFGPLPSTVTGNVTITPANAYAFDGRVLEFTTAATVTVSSGLPVGFGFAFIPPSSGDASIASDGTVQLNGGTSTITRAAAGNALCAVVQRATSANSYVVNGS